MVEDVRLVESIGGIMMKLKCRSLQLLQTQAIAWKSHDQTSINWGFLL